MDEGYYTVTTSKHLHYFAIESNLGSSKRKLVKVAIAQYFLLKKKNFIIESTKKQIKRKVTDERAKQAIAKAS